MRKPPKSLSYGGLVSAVTCVSLVPEVQRVSFGVMPIWVRLLRLLQHVVALVALDAACGSRQAYIPDVTRDML
jgi:hypothetical protein